MRLGNYFWSAAAISRPKLNVINAAAAPKKATSKAVMFFNQLMESALA